MTTATEPTHETTVLHVGGLHYATEKARRRARARRPAGRARRRGQSRRADRDRHLRPGDDLGRRSRGVGRGVRLPLRRPVRSGPHLRPDGRARRRPRGMAHDHAAIERADARPRSRPRRPRRHVDGLDGPRHAQPLPGRARLHHPRSSCGRWSAPSCSAPSWRPRSASTATSGSSCSACRSSSTRRRSSSRARSPPCATGRWT